MPEYDEETESSDDGDENPGEWEAGEKHLVCSVVPKYKDDPDDTEYACSEKDDEEGSSGVSAAF